jgi:hypothetical protein
MTIQITDPLSLVPSPDLLLGPPLTESAARGNINLDTQQRAAAIGDVIPIVFARRVGDTGGVLISPAATEARFEDAANGEITTSYHLVLSEGQIEFVQVRDVFLGGCRVGTYTQIYNKRAGSFTPGNFIDNTPGLAVPRYCGTGGTYEGLSTMSYTATVPAGSEYWNRQVHMFIRGGLRVTRILDSVTGPSNNVVDLLLYLFSSSSKVSSSLIDTATMTTAARFADTNGLWFNGVLADSSNLRDWMSTVMPYFLLRPFRVNGKEALRPVIPFNAATGAINTGSIIPLFAFTEEHILPDGFQITYTPLSDRKDFCVLVLWRQQPTDDIGIIRSTEIRYTDTALNGPYEQHDLSAFCSTENHAVKAGAYILARRKHVTHTLAITVRPETYNRTLVPGDIVQVRMERTVSTGALGVHNELYEIDRVGKSVSGAIQLDLTHFPVDTQLRSVVALEVASAVGNGIVVPTGKSGLSCDINSANDTSVPASFGTSYGGSSGAFGTSIGQQTATSPSGGALATPAEVLPTGTITQSGNELTLNEVCPGMYTEWYLTNEATGETTQVSQGVAATFIASLVSLQYGTLVTGIGRCPDGDGYGPAVITATYVLNSFADTTIGGACPLQPPLENTYYFPGRTGNVSVYYDWQVCRDGSCIGAPGVGTHYPGGTYFGIKIVMNPVTRGTTTIVPSSPRVEYSWVRGVDAPARIRAGYTIYIYRGAAFPNGYWDTLDIVGSTNFDSAIYEAAGNCYWTAYPPQTALNGLCYWSP